MKKLMVLLFLFIVGITVVACDVTTESFTVQEMEVVDLIDNGYILEGPAFLIGTILYEVESTELDLEIGDTVYVRLYESGNVTIISQKEETIETTTG